MVNTLIRINTEISRKDPDFRLWDRGQLVVILSQTKEGRNSIIYGNKTDTLNALKKFIQKKRNDVDIWNNVLILLLSTPFFTGWVAIEEYFHAEIIPILYLIFLISPTKYRICLLFIICKTILNLDSSDKVYCKETVTNTTAGIGWKLPALIFEEKFQ